MRKSIHVATKCGLGAGMLMLIIATASLADEKGKPNDGKAEAAMSNVGEVMGTVVGGVGGAAIGGERGGLAGAAVGVKVGAAAGASAGRLLDSQADENKKTGRGGVEDPRYNPLTLFNR